MATSVQPARVGSGGVGRCSKKALVKSRLSEGLNRSNLRSLGNRSTRVGETRVAQVPAR